MRNDVTGLIVGLGEAEKRGLQPPESTRIALVAAQMPNLVWAFLISRMMAEQQAPAPVALVAASAAGASKPECPCLTAQDLQTAAEAAMQPVTAELGKINDHLATASNLTVEDLQTAAEAALKPVTTALGTVNIHLEAISNAATRIAEK